MSWLINVTSAVFTALQTYAARSAQKEWVTGSDTAWYNSHRTRIQWNNNMYYENEADFIIFSHRRTHAHIRIENSVQRWQSSFLYLMRLALVFEHILLLCKIVKWEMWILPLPIIFSAHNRNCISVCVCCVCGGRKYYVMIIMHWRKSITTNRHFRRRRSHHHHHLCRRTVTAWWWWRYNKPFRK